jgi:hypothetical protein
LEAWKAQFKSEAVRQIAERERLLTEWQARLDRRQAEIDEGLRAAEVRWDHACRWFAHGRVEIVLHESFPERKGARLSMICLLLRCVAISSFLLFLLAAEEDCSSR